MKIIGRYISRQAARDNCGKNQRVVKGGAFANGSFGLYARQKSNGLYYGGNPCPLITVWVVVSKS